MQIEMHFYFFALIAMLRGLRQPAGHPRRRGDGRAAPSGALACLPRSVFNYDAPIWVVAVHAAFVVLDSVAAASSRAASSTTSSGSRRSSRRGPRSSTRATATCAWCSTTSTRVPHASIATGSLSRERSRDLRSLVRSSNERRRSSSISSIAVARLWPTRRGGLGRGYRRRHAARRSRSSRCRSDLRRRRLAISHRLPSDRRLGESRSAFSSWSPTSPLTRARRAPSASAASRWSSSSDCSSDRRPWMTFFEEGSAIVDAIDEGPATPSCPSASGCFIRSKETARSSGSRACRRCATSSRTRSPEESTSPRRELSRLARALGCARRERRAPSRRSTRTSSRSTRPTTRCSSRRPAQGASTATLLRIDAVAQARADRAPPRALWRAGAAHRGAAGQEVKCQIESEGLRIDPSTGAASGAASSTRFATRSTTDSRIEQDGARREGKPALGHHPPHLLRGRSLRRRDRGRRPGHRLDAGRGERQPRSHMPASTRRASRCSVSRRSLDRRARHRHLRSGHRYGRCSRRDDGARR